jgi:hypothetical protein
MDAITKLILVEVLVFTLRKNIQIRMYLSLIRIRLPVQSVKKHLKIISLVGHLRTRKITFAQEIVKMSLSVMSWRRDPNEFANSRIDIESFDTIQTADTRFAFVINPTLSGTNYVLPELTPDDETLLQVSTTGSFDGLNTGIKTWEGLTEGAGGRNRAGSSADVSINLGQDVEFALIARGKAGNSTVDATIRMAEDY